jgi:transposase
MAKPDVLTARQWQRISELLPPEQGLDGAALDPEPAPVVEGIVFRYRAGITWRDLPERFGPWQPGRIPANDATPEVSEVLLWWGVGSRGGLQRRSSVSSSRG